MIRTLLLLLLLGQGMNDATLDARTREVASTLRCPACEDVSIEDSPADLARDMRKLVRQQLADGRTPAQVKQYFVDRYGAWVLLDPAVTRRTAPLWFLPAIAVTTAGAALALALRRWNRASTAVTIAAVPHEAQAARDRKRQRDNDELDELEADHLEGKISDLNFERLRKSADTPAPPTSRREAPGQRKPLRSPTRRKSDG